MYVRVLDGHARHALLARAGSRSADFLTMLCIMIVVKRRMDRKVLSWGSMAVTVKDDEPSGPHLCHRCVILT
jgi:hypothetical protein